MLYMGSINMKKQIVNCETGVTEIVDCTPEEIDKALESASLISLKDTPPPTIEERLAALEAKQ